MDFKQIEAFINVAKFKSFSKAANSSFLSQPAISSHISSLEKEFKIQLFDRTSKEVVLTAAGESFLKYAIDILNTRNKAICHISNFNETVNGKLKLASSTTPCNTIVPTLIKKFHVLYPDVSFNILEQNSKEIIETIIKFDCEVGFIGELVTDEKIKSYELLKDDLIVISSPNFKLPKHLNVESLFEYPFILREGGSATRKTFEKELYQKGYDISNLNACFEVNNLNTLIEFVKQGLGISIISRQVFKNHMSCNLICESIVENLSLTRSIYLILCSKRTLTPTAKVFFNLCREYFNF